MRERNERSREKQQNQLSPFPWDVLGDPCRGSCWDPQGCSSQCRAEVPRSGDPSVTRAPLWRGETKSRALCSWFQKAMDKTHREMEALKGGELNAHCKTHSEALSSDTHTHIYNSHLIFREKKLLFSIFAAGIKPRTAGKFRHFCLSVGSPLT